MLTLLAETLVVMPAVIDVNRLQVEDGLGTWLGSSVCQTVPGDP